MLSFDGEEEKLIDTIISVLDVGREKFIFQQIFSNSEVHYKDIIQHCHEPYQPHFGKNRGCSQSSGLCPNGMGCRL